MMTTVIFRVYDAFVYNVHPLLTRKCQYNAQEKPGKSAAVLVHHFFHNNIHPAYDGLIKILLLSSTKRSKAVGHYL